MESNNVIAIVPNLSCAQNQSCAICRQQEPPGWMMPVIADSDGAAWICRSCFSLGEAGIKIKLLQEAENLEKRAKFFRQKATENWTVPSLEDMQAALSREWTGPAETGGWIGR